MTIDLYRNNSEKNRVTKTLTSLGSLSGALVRETSLTNPAITVTGITDIILNCNYIYIEEFDRFYFVNDIISVRNDMWQLNCNVDVLMSFRNEILNQTAVIQRNEKEWNLYLDDGIFKSYQNPIIQTKNFPSGFSGSDFILAVAGG